MSNFALGTKWTLDRLNKGSDFLFVFNIEVFFFYISFIQCTKI